MPRTRLELVREVMERLGALGAGQALQAEDRETVEQSIASTSANLAARRIAYIPAPDSIPDEWFDPLADVVAGTLTSKFGLIGQEAADLKMAAERGITSIRETKNTEITGARATPDYF